MALLDLAITGARLVTERGVYAADLGVRGGQIALIAAPGGLPPAGETFDATGLLLLPGAIDIHFHCRTPAYPERGDFATETRAAAAGGVTTIFEMPISKPGCATPETFRMRRRLLEEQACINVALFGAPGTLRRDDVLGMAEEGAIAFKIFMHGPPLGREDEFIGICLTDDPPLYDAIRLVGETGRRLVVHCESDNLLEHGIATLRATGRGDAAAHCESRPPVVEAHAIARLLTLAETVGSPVHIAHLSSDHGLRVVRRYQRDGVNVTAETCPQYLFFTQEDFERVGPFGKINPPIRPKGDQEAMWRGLREGVISVVTTDHSTFLVAEKERGRDDIWLAPSGMPGVQTLVSVMLTAALQGRLTLGDVVRLIASEPARMFDLPSKGDLQVGLDADLCLYDPAPLAPFGYEQMQSKARDIDRLYLDYPMQGRVVGTIVGGRWVFREGEVVAPPGSGAFVRPS